MRAVIGVDYAGHPCDWDGLAALAKRYGLQLVNDHCHALGSAFNGDPQFAAKYADAVTLSFHPVKHITTGEGGAVVTKHGWLDEKVKMLRSHGVKKLVHESPEREDPWYYEMVEPGYNYRLTDIQCALGMSQLAKLERFTEQRRAIAAFYDEAFAGDERLVTPVPRTNSIHSYHLYPLQVEFSRTRISKPEFFERLKRVGVKCQVHYIPVHLQPYYRERFGFHAGDYPVAEEFYRREISLPMYPGLEPGDLEYVTQSILSALRG